MLEKPITRVIVAAVAAVAIMAGLTLAFQYKPSPVLTVAQGTEPQQAAPDDTTDSIAAQQELDREVLANQIAYADSRVQALTKDAWNHYVSDVHATSDGGIQATMLVVQKAVTTGDYKTGYVTAYSGKSTVDMIIKNGQIVSYKEVPLADEKWNVTYSEADQKIIENMLANPDVKAKLAEKQGTPVIGLSGTGVGSPKGDCGGNKVLCREAVITLDGVSGPYLEVLIDRYGNVANVAGWGQP